MRMFFLIVCSFIFTSWNAYSQSIMMNDRAELAVTDNMVGSGIAYEYSEATATTLLSYKVLVDGEVVVEKSYEIFKDKKGNEFFAKGGEVSCPNGYMLYSVENKNINYGCDHDFLFNLKKGLYKETARYTKGY